MSMPVTMRALKVYSGASTREFNRKVFYPRYVTVSTMRSPVFAVSAKRQQRSEKVLDHREDLKINVSEVNGIGK